MTVSIQCVLFVRICPATTTDPRLRPDTGAQSSDTYDILFGYIPDFALFLARNGFWRLLDDYLCGATLCPKGDEGGSQYWVMVVCRRCRRLGGGWGGIDGTGTGSQRLGLACPAAVIHIHSYINPYTPI